MSNEVLIKNGDKANWGMDSAPIDPKRLPEGYPYKEEKAFEDIIWDGNTEGRTFISLREGVLCKVGKPIEMDKIIGANLIIHNTTQSKDSVVEIKENQLMRISDVLYMLNSELLICAFSATTLGDTEISESGMYFARISNKYVSGLYVPETTHPISSDFLPPATPTAAGAMKQAAAVTNVTAAPTAEEFNALLKSLRDAGILAIS